MATTDNRVYSCDITGCPHVNTQPLEVATMPYGWAKLFVAPKNKELHICPEHVNELLPQNVRIKASA